MGSSRGLSQSLDCLQVCPVQLRLAVYLGLNVGGGWLDFASAPLPLFVTLTITQVDGSVVSVCATYLGGFGWLELVAPPSSMSLI